MRIASSSFGYAVRMRASRLVPTALIFCSMAGLFISTRACGMLPSTPSGLVDGSKGNRPLTIRSTLAGPRPNGGAGMFGFVGGPNVGPNEPRTLCNDDHSVSELSRIGEQEANWRWPSLL